MYEGMIDNTSKSQAQKHTRISVSLPFLVILATLFVLMFPGSAYADSTTFSSKTDFDNGTYSQTEGYSSGGSVKLKDAGNWGSVFVNTTPLPFNQGSSAVSDGTYVYFSYASDTYFSRYDPSTNLWKRMANMPFSNSIYKSEMIHLNGYIYAFFGGYQKKFARYNISTNEWETLEDAPDYVLYGMGMETDGTYVYVLRGTNTTDMWRYNPATDAWSTLGSAPATMYTGADLAYSGGYLYTPRGNNTTTFYRYSISGNTWSTMTVAPATLNGDHNIIVQGDYIYVTRSGATNTFYRYSISGNSWTTLTSTPQVVNYHAFVYVSGVSKYYLFRGNAAYDIYTYDPTGNTFGSITELPANPSTGADLVYYNGNIYFVRGTSTNYYSYNIASNAWTTRTSAPGNIAAEQKGVVAGSTIYYFTGAGTTFYSYSTGSNTWTTLTAAPAAVSSGDSLAYPGSGDYIYASRGANTGTFWRYSISGNSWSDVAVADLPTNVLMSIGSRIISDGTDIYAFTGGTGKSKLYRYSIGGDSWSDLGTLPFVPYYGTDVTYYSGKFYAQSGYYKRDFWEYTISSGVWRRLDSMSGFTASDIGPYAGGALAGSGSSTLYSIWGANFARMQSYTIDADMYESTGTWTSNTIDLEYVSSFSTLTATTTTPGTSTVSFETRTSVDGTTWSGWQSLSGSNIQSPARRYIQVRATLSADLGNDQTPILSDFTVNYASDSSAPTNASTFNGSSQQVSGVSLTSGQSYSYVHPYFTWSGASDTESTIAGYHVYFGTSSSADPEVLGSFTSTATYIVTENLTNGTTYYLRVKTEDSAGNVSSATTGFTYVYTGVTAASSSFTSSVDFSGTNSSTVSTGNEIKLSSDSTGIWEQERISLAPATLSTGSNWAYVASSNKFYTFRGTSTTTFYSYDVATDVWSTLAVAPATVSAGWVIEGPSGYLYAARGLGTSSFWQYNIAANTWSDANAADAPLSLTSGSAARYDGSRYIYVSRGTNDDAFFRYDTQTDSWETLANVTFDVLNAMYSGADIAYNPAGYIYAIQGGGYSGFSQYSIASNSWTVLPPLPHIANNDGTITYHEGENAVYYVAGATRTAFYKYDVGEETWTELPDVPATVGQGADIRDVGDKLYLMRGNSTQNIYTFNVETNAWIVPNMGIFGTFFRGTDYHPFTTGAEIVKGDESYYYVAKGNSDNLFVRYDADTGTVLPLSDIPFPFASGSELAYDSANGIIYAIGSTNNTGLFVYTISTDSWSEITTDPLTAAPSTGAAIRYDGARYLYYLRGGNTTSFYRYDSQASPGARWSTLSVLPAAASTGADLIYKDGYVYALRGNNTTNFYRYSVSGASWATMTAITAAVNTDGFLVDGGDSDSLVGCRGGNTAICYKYSIAGDSWSLLDTSPANFNSGAAGDSGSYKMYAIGGQGTNTFTDGLYSYVLPTSTSSFAMSGEYTSQSHNLGSIYKLSNLTVTYAQGESGTSMTPYTRSSDDGADWSSWTAAANPKENGSTTIYEIKSPDNQYLEVKFELTSGGGIYTDVIDSYSIGYYTDSTAPTNPTDIVAYTTATQSATITTDTWYAHSEPNFDWPDAEVAGGATDGAGGSGIDGYYVYFGTDESADPEVDGTLQTTTAFTADSLTTGETYYLRILAVDDAENVSASVWDAFTYKYDATAPTNPSSISSNPPGYSTSSAFTFTWSAGSDANSGIDVYCWSTEDAGVDETCVEDRIATASAYTTGANTFYVRARDLAGNYAGSYVNASYYYTGGAPGAPTNLEATPSTSTQNSFSFTWDAPEVDGDEDDIRYYYSVNALPTAENVIEVGRTRVLLSDSYATQRGANIMYIVAQYPSTYTIDEDPDSIDFNNYASTVFTANTTAPGSPEAVEIADVSVKSTESWKLALTWNEPTASGSGVSSYKVYRSAVTDASCTTDIGDFTNVASSSEPSYVGSNLLQQTYYYCIKACDSTGNCSPPSSTVSLYPDGRWESAPELVASPSATVKTRTATISWSTDRTSSSFIKYGKSSGDYGDEVGSSDQVTAHEVVLKDLEPGTTYYYQALWSDEDGNLGESDEITFATNAAPYVANVEVSDISTNDAYVSANITYATSAVLQYGPTTAYGGSVEIPVSPSGGSYSVRLENLLEDTEYHVRIVAEDDEGNEYIGEDHIFQTFPVPKINEALMKVQQITGLPTATLRIVWVTNTETSSIITYYPTANPELAKDSINLVRSLNHQTVIKDLKDETEYTLIIKGRDIAGNETLPVTKTVTTAEDLREPSIIDMTVESTIVGVGDDSKAQIIVCWKTDEPSTTQVEYNQGTGGQYGSSTQEDTTLNSDHCVTVAGIEPSSIYQVRAVSKDKAGNVGRSFDTVIVTPQSTKSALNLVVEKLSTTFGFLKFFQK